MVNGMHSTFELAVYKGVGVVGAQRRQSWGARRR